MKASEVALIGSAFHILQHEIFMNARNKGFYGNPEEPLDLTKVNKGERIALMHSELSEALEGIRKSGDHKYVETAEDTCKCGDRRLSKSHVIMDEHCPEFTSEEIELADCVIRILDHAEAFGLKLDDAILAKHEYNTTREYMHGKKF